MKKFLSAVALCALAAPAAAVTVDLSDGAFNSSTRSWFFNDIATVGGKNVNLSVTTSPGLVSTPGKDSVNTQLDTNYFRAQMDNDPSGNSSVFHFQFLDDNSAPVIVRKVGIGVFDLDFNNGERVVALGALSATITAASTLNINSLPGAIEVIGQDGLDATNPTDFTNLTAEQQNASVDFNFGNKSEFMIEASVAPNDRNGGRAFYFGNLEFTEPTVTVEPAPVPLPPALALIFSGLGGLVLLGRFRRNRDEA